MVRGIPLHLSTLEPICQLKNIESHCESSQIKIRLSRESNHSPTKKELILNFVES
jgi:hypothetical protein